MVNYSEIVRFIRLLYNQPEGIIPLHAPVFKGNEKKYLEECIESTYVSSVGRFVERFENDIAIYTGAKKAVACVNGTSALHLALKLVGVEAGHEVLTQPLTFVATSNAISYCGAHPVFLDIDKETLGLSPDSLEQWLKHNIIYKKQEPSGRFSGSETKNLIPFNKYSKRQISACLPMHTFGLPCRIDEILKICANYNIPLIEDAAESLGSFYKGKHTGTYGMIGVLSFNGNKIITTGGGGMLLFQNEELGNYAKHLSTQAKVPHEWEYEHRETGYNYRMPNINSALGCAQLEQLPQFLASKRQIAKKYEDFFSGIESSQYLQSKLSRITYIKEPNYATSNFWLNCILMEDKNKRDDLLKFTNENGVTTRPTWMLMNELEMFRNCQKDNLKNAIEISTRLVNLPSSSIV